MRPLVVPPAAQRDENAVEMLRAWIAEEELHCVLNVGMWEARGLDEASSWGILLADVIRHLAHAVHEERGTGTAETIEKATNALLAELKSPTSDASGGYAQDEG